MHRDSRTTPMRMCTTSFTYSTTNDPLRFRMDVPALMTPIPLPPLIVLVGPTAVGKTALAVTLAKRFDGEIVNGDSRLFYRGMDIGTAKPTLAERRGIPHHLVDIADPNDTISLALFLDAATAAIDDIHARGKLPFLVGGTPQYVNAVVEGWQVPRVEPDPALRGRLEKEAATFGTAHLSDRLRAVDSAAAEIHGTNLRRIIRALEVWEKTGIPISQQQSRGPAPYHALELELWRPRESLHQRVADRAQGQIRAGLVDEVHRLLAAGADPASSSFGSIGYRQVMPYIRGEIGLDEVTDQLRFACNRLIRQQETWFRKNARLIRIDLDDPSSEQTVTALIQRFLASNSPTETVI